MKADLSNINSIRIVDENNKELAGFAQIESISIRNGIQLQFKCKNPKTVAEPTTLQVMHQMVKDSNNGISLATTIADVKGTKQGVVVGFGMKEQFAGAANMEWMGVGSDTIFLAFTINRDQLAKTKAKMMEE